MIKMICFNSGARQPESEQQLPTHRSICKVHAEAGEEAFTGAWKSQDYKSSWAIQVVLHKHRLGGKKLTSLSLLGSASFSLMVNQLFNFI